MASAEVFDRMVEGLQERGFSDAEIAHARHLWITGTGNHPPCPECSRKGKMGRIEIGPGASDVRCTFCGASFGLSD